MVSCDLACQAGERCAAPLTSWWACVASGYQSRARSKFWGDRTGRNGDRAGGNLADAVEWRLSCQPHLILSGGYLRLLAATDREPQPSTFEQ